MSDDDLQVRIGRELAVARELGYARIDSKPMVDTSLLERAATRIHGYRDGMSRANKIELLLTHEVPLAPVPYRRQLIVLFGLLHLLEPSDPLTREKLDPTQPRSLRRKAMAIANETAVDNYRRGSEPDALGALAAQIIADCFPPLGSDTATSLERQRPRQASEAVALNTGYVPRGEIESQFHALVKQGAKLIAFVGFPGMGKTSIARALTQGNPFIEFIGGRPRAAHLQQAINQYCNDVEMVGTENAGPLLGTLLNQEQGPRFVVLDNLQSTAELRMVPLDTATTVVATCRKTGSDSPSWCEEIRVNAMKEPQATHLAEKRDGSLSRAEARFVANSLGRYPLLISTACRLATVTGLDIRNLCQELQLNPGDTPTRADETLRQTVARGLSFLKASEPAAVDLLTCISYGERQLSVQHLYDLVRSRYGDAIAGIRCAQALNVLQDLALIELVPVRMDLSRLPNNEAGKKAKEILSVLIPIHGVHGMALNEKNEATVVYIHPVISALLKSLLKTEASEIGDHLNTELLRILPQYESLFHLFYQNTNSPPGLYAYYKNLFALRKILWNFGDAAECLHLLEAHIAETLRVSKLGRVRLRKELGDVEYRRIMELSERLNEQEEIDSLFARGLKGLRDIGE